MGTYFGEDDIKRLDDIYGRTQLINQENIKYLVIHCSDTDENDSALDIHKLHLSFGWDGIGYHKVIKRDGIIGNGRPEYWVGAHVYKYNHVSLEFV